MESKKRNPFISLFLGIMSTGLGQMYNGQFKKGIVFLLIGWILVFTLGIIGLYKTFYGLFSILAFVIIYRIIIIIEALFVSIRKKDIFLKNYNNWFSYFLYVIMTMVLSFVILSKFAIPNFIPVKGYEIVAGSMKPTLIPGDRVMFDYKYFDKNKPQIGDIVSFGYDDSPNQIFISRIIAIEGDTLEYRNGILLVNGKKKKETFIANDSSQPNFGPVKIPKNKVFMMGDNRNNSYDSRQRGSVSISNLKGKYLYKYLKN